MCVYICRAGPRAHQGDIQSLYLFINVPLNMVPRGHFDPQIVGFLRYWDTLNLLLERLIVPQQ